jgi:hypothetical protein
VSGPRRVRPYRDLGTLLSPRLPFVILPAVKIGFLLIGERDLEGLALTMLTVLHCLRDLHDNHGIITNTIHREFKTILIRSIFPLERNLLLYLAVNIKACGTMESEHR